jgi:antimicrobial peptide system SdpA family protein
MELDTRAVRWTRIRFWSVWGVLIVSLTASTAGEGPLKPSSSIRLVQLSLLPQGWSFFTRDPREPTDVVYRMTGTGLEALTFANTSQRSLFGLSRRARVHDAELMALLAPVMQSTWKPCDVDPAGCGARYSGAPLEVANWAPTRMICGDIVVVRSRPVPWAWRRARDRLHMDSRLVRMRVDCSSQRQDLYP